MIITHRKFKESRMAMMTQRVRIYPTRSQKKKLAQHFGTVRFIYNWALAQRIDAYKRGDKLTPKALSAMLTALRKEEATSWLNDVSLDTLQEVLKDLKVAYDGFFRRCKQKDGKALGFPKFKSKHRSKQACSFDDKPKAHYYGNGRGFINVPKLKHIKFRSGYESPLDGTLRRVTISLNKAGEYHASLCYRLAVDDPTPMPYDESNVIGFDMGVKDLVVASDGRKYNLPKQLKIAEAKVISAQRKLSKRKRGSGRYAKQRLVVAKRHNRVKNIRKDFLHKLSRHIVDDNQVNALAFETLGVQDMLVSASSPLSRNMARGAFALFINMVEQKAKRKGKQCLKADRYDATSKTCHVCGNVRAELSLSVRSWQCASCGTLHDRDLNAAQNVKTFALLRAQGVRCKGNKPPLLDEQVSSEADATALYMPFGGEQLVEASPQGKQAEHDNDLSRR
jgi:putative transposase